MATRIRREIEPKWVSWYIAKRFENALVKPRCPLGPIPEELVKLHGLSKAIKVHRPWRPEVDACVILPDRIILVEAKIQKFMDGISKLPVYKSLIPATPELKAWKDLPVEMRLLIPAEVEWVRTAAKKMDVKIIVDAPDFILKVWEDRDKYWTKPLMEEREARKEKLRELGYV